MNESQLVSQIRKSWTYAKALKIDESFSGPTSLKASEEFKRLAISPTATYEELYLFGLRESQYNFILRDYSYFQFGIGGTDGVRFAFYPNPFLGASPDAVAQLTEMQEYVLEGIIEIEEFLHRISEIRKPQHPPLIRYEYSKDQYVAAEHPCSHLHLGFHSNNRWPVRRYLTANAFSLLVFRLFYLNVWLSADKLKVGDVELSLDETLAGARSESRLLYADEFSDEEDKRFHFI
jgi:hypothetical protein